MDLSNNSFRKTKLLFGLGCQHAIQTKEDLKLRSHVSHGHSHLGKHQKHSEGQGNAGGTSHQRVNFNKHHPGYSGKAGMRQYHLREEPGFLPNYQP